MRQQYPINYVYGFSSEGFSYFMTTQKKDTSGNSPFISKLVRVCQNDSNYYSYTEIPLECISDSTGKKFELIQAAYLGKPGPDLANKLDITHSDDVLFTVFSVPDPIGSSTPSRESALCVYSLKDIRRKFVENIEMCFQGKGSRGLGFIATNAPCVPTVCNI
jgi:plexin A